jgi:hypothetical protein
MTVATTAMRAPSRFILSIFLLCFAGIAFAQNGEITESDKAVFAFFTLNGHTPAYEQWIENSPKYLAQTTYEGKREVLEAELLRLKWGFGTYDVARDFIKIRTPVKLLIQGNHLAFSFHEASGKNVPYFPFPYGKEWIALIINDLDPLFELELTPEERTRTASLPKNVVFDGEIVLHLRPIKADNNNTQKLDGTDHWLMMSDTGRLELLSEGTVLATYTAPWFLESAEKGVLPGLQQ